MIIVFIWFFLACYYFEHYYMEGTQNLGLCGIWLVTILIFLGSPFFFISGIFSSLLDILMQIAGGIDENN